MAKGEWKRTTQLINAAIEILEKLHPMTIRQLFYRLVSIAMIPNDQESYKLVSRVMTKARLDERCDPDYIVDRSRPHYAPDVFENSDEYAEVVKNGYRRDYWSAQSSHVEIWSEKDAVMGSVEPTTNELGIDVRVGRGFISTTRQIEIADFFRTVILKRQKPIFVYYLGDFDPSGVCIEEDALQRVRERLDWLADLMSVQRIAIMKEDIRKFNLPPLRTKEGDSRTIGFKRTHGEECVELDALPPDELRARIKKAVEAHIDRAAWNQAIAVEKVELESIRRASEMWACKTDTPTGNVFWI